MYHKNHHFTILRELDVIEKKGHERKLPRYANVSQRLGPSWHIR